ncbi:hypothetical protein ACDX78_20000 [Virgibacillus oceani]
MKITIGDKNKIKNSSIGHHFGLKDQLSTKKNFAERHPIFISFIVSLLVGFILLFSFWDRVIKWVEGFLN